MFNMSAKSTSKTIMPAENIFCHDYHITRDKRNEINGHRSFVIWFMGFSGSGKSTIANLLEKQLFSRGVHTFSLDGDNIRTGINKNLGFSEDDRNENIRRIAEISKLFIQAGTVVIAAFITPLEKDRKVLRQILGKQNVVEVFVNTTLEECERRDIKGLYKKARAGEIKNFTGISAPFEIPGNADVEIDTSKENVETSVDKVIACILPKLEL